MAALVARKLIPIAATGAGQMLWARSVRSIGVLPNRPRFPIRRHNWCRPVLGQPKPAIGKDGILICPQKFFYIMARIESRPAAGRNLDVSHKCTGLF